jgi:tripartite-type tricarboxylate transporter receptor subunit TctC
LRALMITAVLMAAVSTIASGPVAAQAWPERPVTIIVPSAPGDGSDVAARAVADRLKTLVPQGVLVDNRPGAGGVTGSVAAMRAAPDGHTFVMAHAGSHGINPAIMTKPPYDPSADFKAVTLVYRAPNIFLAGPKLGVKSMGELVTLAKGRGTPLNYASGGIGSSAHMNAEYLKVLTGIGGNHVPYRGSSPALNDLVGGQVDFMAVNLPPALGLVQSGQLTPLAVTTAKRAPSLPNVPTMQEAGFAGYETVAWFGLFAPAGTPDAIITRVAEAIRGACGDAEFGKRFDALGGELVCNTPAEFAAFVAADVKRWREVAAKAGIRLETQ